MKNQPMTSLEINKTVRGRRFPLPCLPAIAALAVLLMGLSSSLSAQQLVGQSPRAEVTLNGMWTYVLNQSQDTIPTSGWIPTRVPAMPIEDGTTSVWYETTVNVPNTWVKTGRSFFLELEKAGHYSAIYVNGTYIGEHYGQFSPFEQDISASILPGQPNKIDIYVHKADTTYVRARERRSKLLPRQQSGLHGQRLSRLSPCCVRAQLGRHRR